MIRKVSAKDLARIEKSGGKVRQRKKPAAPKPEPQVHVPPPVDPSVESIAAKLEEVTRTLADIQETNQAMMMSFAQVMAQASVQRVRKMHIVRKDYPGIGVPLIDDIDFTFEMDG